MEQFGLRFNRRENNNVEKNEVFDAIFNLPQKVNCWLLNTIRKDVQEFRTCRRNTRLDNAQINQITDYKEDIVIL